jgi:hypothetical protein
VLIEDGSKTAFNRIAVFAFEQLEG